MFDFKFLGYPQLQIYFFEALEAEVFDFSTSGNFQIPIVNHIKTSNSCLSTVKNCMIEKLSVGIKIFTEIMF